MIGKIFKGTPIMDISSSECGGSRVLERDFMCEIRYVAFSDNCIGVCARFSFVRAQILYDWCMTVAGVHLS